MGLCQRIKTDRVLYDERIFINETENAIPLGVKPAAGSTISRNKSSAEVAVVECDVVRSGSAITAVDVTLFIEKNIVVDQPGELPDLLFEFSFQKTFRVPLVKIGEATISPADAARADCQIVDMTATDVLTLTNPSSDTATATATVKDELVVAVKLKLVVPHDQILVALCPANMSTLATVTVKS